MFLISDGEYDYYFAPLFTLIKVPEDRIVIVRVIVNLLGFLPVSFSYFAYVLINVLPIIL